MARFHSFLSFLLFFIVLSAQAQVIINEVSSSNTSLADEDGDYEDWIELYNPSGSPVNLLNYKLTDSAGWIDRWTFPNISIPANSYLTVFASGKNRTSLSTVDHWEALVLENHTWKYIIPSSNISGWNSETFDDAAWSSGPGGIGYGDSDDGTVITNPSTSVFMRRTFNVVDSAAIKSLRFYMDCDDGFVAYLNGVEIARDNISGVPPAYNALATADREAKMYTGGDPNEYIISPSVFLPLIKNGNNVLAIQVHNRSSTSTDLSARPFLLAGINNGSVNYSPVPGWFDEPLAETSYLHTNFSIKSGGGETVLLSDPSNTIVSSVFVPALSAGDTYGRYPNGSGTWSILRPATPNASNSSSTSYSGYLNATVTMSVPPGFYSGTQTVSCTCSDPTAQIRYTTDGTKPSGSSTLYTGPLSVNSTRVLRAVCYKSGYLSKNVETNTYFINDPGISVPVISISTKPSYFFSNDSGIYVMGPNADGASPHYGANFWMDWEREVHIEYFKNGNHEFEQDCGIKIFGGWSRANAMKSMRLVPDEKYGPDRIYYPLFSEKPNIDEFTGVHLRNGGNDFNYTHLRDQTNHRVLSSKQNILGNKTHIDFSAYEPIAVFINGSYWGIHHMRERFNKGYLEGNHGVSEFEMLEMDGDVIRESNTHFLNMTSFIQNNDMSNTANYNTVKGWLDIENFADYFIAQTYHTNWDWPNNNVKYWRALPDGKWRYLYYDTDFAFAMFNFISASTNELSNVINSTGGNNRSGLPNPHGPMLKKLLDNTEFKNYFINRYADLMNTIYQPSNYKAVFDGLKSQLSPEMSRHFTRWPQNSGNTSGWNSNCDGVRSYMDARLPYARNHVQSTFSLAGQVNVTLNVNPAGAGVIKISTITPDTYPWTGVYFNGVPVTITAIANPGYTFANWSSSSISLGSPNNSSITLNIGSNNTFTANFTTTTSIPRITINEINYNPDADFHAGNWIELYNYGNAPMDLSGWKFKDANEFNVFTIPNGTTLGAGQYLVLVEDAALFTALHPTVTNYIGDFGFDLANSGELLRLYDNIGRLYLSVTYDDNSPWPQYADGDGSTLELIDPTGDLNDGTNWFDGCRGGSPGTAYVPCPCTDVNLGPDQILCVTGGSYTINTGLTAHPDRTFTWYLNGNKLNGVNTPTLTASLAGEYRVVVDSMGCLQSDEITLTSNLTFNLGPDATLCDPATVTLSSGLSGAGINYVWRKDGTIISGETGSSLLVSTPGTYRLDVTAGTCTAQNDQVVVTSIAPVPVHASRCGTGTVNLGVTGTGTFEWYTAPTGGSPIATGTSYTTPSLSSTTTYYVEDASFYGNTVGPENPEDVGDEIWTTNKYEVEENGKLIFDVLQPLTLNAVTVFTEGAQTVTIRVLQPNKSTVRFSKTVAVSSAGEHRIPLGFEFGSADVKNGYYMDLVGSTGEFEMNGADASYPYTVASWIRITGTDPSWAGSAGWYFFAYNWEFSNKPGPCERVPVVATINPALGMPDVITGNFNVCSGTVQTYSVPLLTGATDYTWTVPSGSTITSGQGTNTITVNVGSTGGNITVTPSNSCGSGTARSQALTVTGSGLSPAVSISITSGNNPTCFGSSVTFTATPTNGGVSPTYQWNRNGSPVSGAISSAFTTSSITDGDVITCTMTSSLSCASPLTVTSSGITMTVNSTVIPSVSISITSGSNPTCSGGSVTFTATPVDGGASPSYQWRRNGTNISGATGSTFTTSTLADGDVITCRMTSNATCASPATVTSSGITMSVTPSVTPSVSIAITSGSNPICAGSSVTFTATPTNGGTTPVYQWNKNGNPISGEQATTFTSSTLADGDIITCSMTSNATCASPATVTSSGITMTVNPVVSPSVGIAITSGANPTCAGSPVTFTATPTGGGTTPTYQWNRNGIPVGGQTSSVYTTSALVNGDVITCTMTSNAVCASPITTTSTGITMTVNSSITPSVSISITSGSNPTCSGSGVTFTATPTGGGASPSYQWRRNGTAIPDETASTYTSTTLANGDVITCVMTSSDACASPASATSSGITMTINPVVTPSVSIAITSGANPACSGSSITFTATPINGGTTPAYQWNRNGTPIPGEEEVSYTSTTLLNGDVITCSMTSNTACANPATVTSTGITMTVNPVVTPSVSIAITSGVNPACSGSSITFTATPVNGGTTPAYQWNKNGSPISGATSVSYTTNTLADGDVITCSMTSNAACASPVTVTSSGITMSVTTSVIPSVSIALTSGSNPSCLGSSVTFTATPVNGGATPAYQWNKNGSPVGGAVTATYSASDLIDGDIITCTITSNAACASPLSATSAGITMSMINTVTPSVGIAITSGSNPGCSGSSVTFEATPVNSGGSPVYQWNLNGSPVPGENSLTYTSNTLANGDVVGFTLTSNATCASPATVTSNSINMNINGTVTPGAVIAVTSGSNPTCSGAPVTFTVTPSNEGSTPSYQWNVNGSPVPDETGISFTSSTLTNGDVVTCTVTSSIACASPASVTSSGITMTVDATVSPAVSIAITTGANPTCAGSSVTFEATPTNGGASPAYQWNLNGSPIGGEIASVYSTSTLADGDIVSCTMISNLGCASPASVTSSGIAMTVNPAVSPAVTIDITSGSNPTCTGSSVTFTATPVNGGGSPVYQWNKNGTPVIGASASSYTTSGLANGDVITCTLTSNATCASPVSVTSSGITMNVNGTVSPSVSIAITSGSNPVCSGTSVTFTASPVNGGTPSYQWNINGSPVGGEIASTFASSTLTDGDIVTCTMTSSLACASPVSVTSSGITMDINPSLLPAVNISITSGGNTICSGVSVTFTASSINEGLNPVYQWNKNGSPVPGANTSSFTSSTLANGDEITCTLTSDAVCAAPATVTSSGITMTVNPTVTPSVSIAITSGSNPACTGTAITFAATPVDGGGSPSYQWNLNGSPVGGATSSVYASSSLANGDIVSCTMISSAACASPVSVTSSDIIMSVNSILSPSVSISQSSGSDPSCAGSPVSFTASPVNGGSTPGYQWNINGTAQPGETSAVFTSSDLSDGDVITCTLTSSEACASPASATSSGITVNISNPLTPSVSIAITAGNSTVCEGTLVEFTATPVNGGSTPAYQWFKNGLAAGGETAATYASSSFADGDVISCELISSENCVSFSTASSSTIAVNVDQMPTPANAGPDQNLTVNTTNLAANTPLIGVGEWSQISGGGFIGNVSDPVSLVGGLPDGNNIYRWTISNGVCPDSYDEVTVTVGTPQPFVINGPDNVTPGNTYTYTVPFEPGASYVWIVPSGATIVSGNGTSTITVTFAPGVGGTIYVGKSGGTTGNATANKNISVITAINDPTSSDSYVIFPNPFTTRSSLVINSSAQATVHLVVMDTKGIILFEDKKHSTNEEIILGDELRSGVYIVQAHYADRVLTFRVVKSE